MGRGVGGGRNTPRSRLKGFSSGGEAKASTSSATISHNLTGWRPHGLRLSSWSGGDGGVGGVGVWVSGLGWLSS